MSATRRGPSSNGFSCKPRRLTPAISPLWIETLVPARLPETPPEERRVVTLEIVRALIAVKHEPNDLALWRDKAAAAFLFLSGMRAAAFVSLPLKCVSVAQREWGNSNGRGPDKKSQSRDHPPLKHSRLA